jgi:hypothetical protein
VDYLKVRNWKKLQHYKNRDPKWIKLYRSLLRDREWHALDGETAKFLVMVWLLAAEYDQDGSLPPVEDIAFQLRLDANKTKKLLNAISPWLEHSASEPLAGCYPPASAETEGERETEEEAETEKRREPLSPSPSPAGKGSETFSEPNGDGDIRLGLAFFAEATKKRARVEREEAAKRVLEFCLGLKDRPNGKPAWTLLVESARAECLKAISNRLKDGYDEERLKRHAEFFVSLRRADGRYLEKYGHRPEYGDPFWCPGPTWKIWELFGPTRFDKYGDWSDRKPITGEDLENRWIGEVYQ